MKTEEQRIAIAKALGWTDIKHYPDSNRWWATRPDTRELDFLPNYPADLNAMHEAEKTLIAKSQQDRFVHRLWFVIGAGVHVAHIGWDSQEWILIHSTAAQRAEAFIRTLNLWKE